MSGSDEETDLFLYDAIVMQVDAGRRALAFSANGESHTLYCEHASSFSVGAIGRLRLPTAGQPFAFQVYADQRLRRATDFDEKANHRWGWRIGERKFTVHWGILPGRNGAVVSRDLARLEIDIPHELIDLCARSSVEPKAVLKSFIGSLCKLTSPFERPREDGYSNISAELADIAVEYFQTAFHPTPTELMPPRQHRGRRRKTPALIQTPQNVKRKEDDVETSSG
jgi:hypothetical protein